MDRRLMHALRGVPQKVIIDELGWTLFFEYKVACYRGESPQFHARTGLLGFLGMTEKEYAEWIAYGEISDRVRRVWS